MAAPMRLSGVGGGGSIRWGRIAAGIGVVFGLLVLSSGMYTVAPNEVAGMREFGKVVSKTPIGPGWHFKLPFVESVDTIQTSISKFAVNDLHVYTVDNQPITVGVNITYNVPASAAFHLLYDVGRIGNFDVWKNVEPVVASEVAQVFAQENTVSISEDRGKLNEQITQGVRNVLVPLFGLNIRDVEITQIQYGASFEQSINEAVLAKNRAIAAENEVNQVRYEADQAKIKAQGQAQAAIAAATGAKEAAILRAEGHAQAIALTGTARAKAIAAIGQAVSQNPQIIRYAVAKRWRGLVPETVISNGKGVLPLLNFSTSGMQAKN